MKGLLYHGREFPHLVLTPCSADYPVCNARWKFVRPFVHSLDGNADQGCHFLYGPEVLDQFVLVHGGRV